MEEARSHQSVNWLEYFESIQRECPWSLRAYKQNKIEIIEWHTISEILPLGSLDARMYIVDYPDVVVEGMALELDTNDSESDWLFSYPGYGEFATPVKVLIQQNRKQLNDLRTRLSE